ncbi:MAG: oxidoreductase, partial [Mesorhizobium sp.]
EDGKETTAPVRAAAKAGDLGAQDYVVLALKAHSVAPALDQIAPLLGPDTSVVTMQNGVPWWYFYKAGGALEGTRLQQVDPGGTIWERLG